MSKQNQQIHRKQDSRHPKSGVYQPQCPPPKAA